jgi:hypothetical protein
MRIFSRGNSNLGGLIGGLMGGLATHFGHVAEPQRNNPFRAGSTAQEQYPGNGHMKGDQIMKRFTKVALATLLLAGATTAVAAPASARVFVGIGAPVAYAPGPICNPYNPYYNPYYCGYGPGYVGGVGFGFGGWHGGGFHDGGFHGGGFHGGGFHGGGHR